MDSEALGVAAGIRAHDSNGRELFNEKAEQPEAPNSNIQIPDEHQIPSSNLETPSRICGVFGVWSLVLVWMLEFGASESLFRHPRFACHRGRTFKQPTPTSTPESSAQKHLAQVGGTAGLNGVMVHNVDRVGPIGDHSAAFNVAFDIRARESGIFLLLCRACGGLRFRRRLAVRRFFFGLFILLLVIGERTGDCAHSDQKG
jgi:hypothetical protein